MSENTRRNRMIIVVAVVLCLAIVGLALWQFNAVVNYRNRHSEYSEAWNVNPKADYGEIAITNLQPDGSSLNVQYTVAEGAVFSYVRIVAQGAVKYETIVEECSVGNHIVTMVNLVDDTYNVTVYGQDSSGNLTEGNTRISKTGDVEGTVVAYLNPDDDAFSYSGQYLCSPSIARLSDGTLFVTHDLYEGGVGNQNLTRIYRSTDNGVSWEYISELYPCFWGKLFTINDKLYMIGCSTEYGDLLVGSSSDGITWSAPTMILKGGNRVTGGVHKAPNPVLIDEGRVYCPVEFGSWIASSHDAGYVTAPVDSDLLDAANWTVSNFLPYKSKNVEGALSGKGLRYLEGNILRDRSGELVEILRYNTKNSNEPYGKAVLLKINRETNTVMKGQTIDFIGNMTKFNIVYDEVSDRYVSLVNRVTNGNPNQRNVLTLVDSYDLYTWNNDGDIINYEDNGYPEDDTTVAFQYVDYIIVGEDILFVSRTAMNGADNYHNNNYVTFHRIENFRQMLSN